MSVCCASVCINEPDWNSLYNARYNSASRIQLIEPFMELSLHFMSEAFPFSINFHVGERIMQGQTNES